MMIDGESRPHPQGGKCRIHLIWYSGKTHREIAFMDEDLYGNNIMALGRVDPDLIAWMEGAETPRGVGLRRTELGAMDLLIGSESGKQVLYYGGSPSVL
jgi:hypothetical protein